MSEPHLKAGSRWRRSDRPPGECYIVVDTYPDGMSVVLEMGDRQPGSEVAVANVRLYRRADDHLLHATGIYADEVSPGSGLPPGVALREAASEIGRVVKNEFTTIDGPALANWLSNSPEFARALHAYATQTIDHREDFRKGYEKGREAARAADAETVGCDSEPETGGTVELKLMDVIEAFFLSVPRGGTFTYTAPPECPDEEAVT